MPAAVTPLLGGTACALCPLTHCIASMRTPIMAENDRTRLAASAGVDTGEEPALSISSEKVCFIVFKVREFDVKDAPTLADDGSDPPDEEMRPVLEDRPDDPVWQELVAAIGALSFDEQVDLVTLMWMGRGDGTIAER